MLSPASAPDITRMGRLGRVELAALPRTSALMLRPVSPSFLLNHFASPHTFIFDHARATNYRSFSLLCIICTVLLSTPKDRSQCRVSVPSTTRK